MLVVYQRHKWVSPYWSVCVGFIKVRHRQDSATTNLSNFNFDIDTRMINLSRQEKSKTKTLTCYHLEQIRLCFSENAPHPPPPPTPKKRSFFHDADQMQGSIASLSLLQRPTVNHAKEPLYSKNAVEGDL